MDSGSYGLQSARTEEEFSREVYELAVAEAPRLFAVVQEYGERVDGWVAAWGLAFEDGRAEVVGVEGRTRLRLGAPERALNWFGRRPETRARLVWLDGPGAPLAQPQG